ncbi:MAG: hypothetical protein C4524_03015 [Candidatus Zixiibacteriota bacterium]|nr:MAG: hypothetical protein C4524_03015 [candidate division Zixibacteria bacterium]
MVNRALALLLLGLLCAALPALASPDPSLEWEQSAKLARTFLRDHRYAEASALLDERLATLPSGEPRLPLLLLLTDALLGLGDLDRASATLTQADAQVTRTAERKAVDRRREALEKRRLAAPPAPPPAPEEAFPAPDTALPGAPGETVPVTNSFFETDLRQVLTDLSMESGIPILWDATVQGLVTYEAQDQPLEEVLKAVLVPMGYAFTFQDGAYYVGSSRPEDPAFGLLSKTQTVVLSNLDAGEAIGLLSDYFKPYVKASKSSNLVCITAPPTLIERIRADLLILDQPQDQVLIEVVITEISSDALRAMGLDWSVAAPGSNPNPAWNVATDHTFITNPAISGSYAEIGVDIGNYTVDLAASLEALVQTGEAKIRANPRITTLNSHPAQISIVKDQYFIIQTGSSQYYQYNTLQAVSSGIKLEITPYTSPSGEITMVLKPEVGDVVGQGQNNLPEINRRSASTSVRVQDGETFSIGGLSLQSEKITQRKIPLLGEIPILGYLFRYDQREKRDSEIVIFVTPYILKG